MHHFCTYFDYHYLPRGIALYRSLRQHCPAFQLWVLCLDPACYEVLSQLKLPDVRLIALEDFEADDKELLRAKQNRTLIEYYFTCTPSLPLFIFSGHPEVRRLTYLDADLFFFSDPTPIFEEIGGKSIAIIGHRFPPSLRHNEVHGIYNVGWVSFARDEQGFDCLQSWREQCLDWCYDRVEDGRFADQKYLDVWPERFSSTVIVQHKGANLGPWNLARYEVRKHGNRVWVDEQPLIFFHFHGLNQVSSWLYDPNLAVYQVRASRVVRRNIYLPYIRTLSDAIKQASPIPGSNLLGAGIRKRPLGTVSRRHVATRILARRYLVVP